LDADEQGDQGAVGADRCLHLGHLAHGQARQGHVRPPRTITVWVSTLNSLPATVTLSVPTASIGPVTATSSSGGCPGATRMTSATGPAPLGLPFTSAESPTLRSERATVASPRRMMVWLLTENAMLATVIELSLTASIGPGR